VERLEERALLSVNSLNITSITSAADADGNPTNEHVTVVAGSTVTVAFSYSSTAANETTAKVDVNTSPATVSTSSTVVNSGLNQTASLSLVIPAGTTAGNYTAHVLVKNGSGGGSVANESDASSVEVTVPITVIDTTVGISAPTITYGDDALVTVSVTPAGATGSASLAVDGGAAASQNLISSSTQFNLGLLSAGDHPLSASYTSDSTSYANDGPVSGSIHVNQAPSSVSVTGGVFTYDGNAHGGSGVTVSGAGVITGSATLAYYDAADTLQEHPLSGAPVNAGSYTVVATYVGDSNHTGSSASASIVIDKVVLGGSATTQDALNIAKQGSLTFTLDLTGFVDGEHAADVMTGATFSLQIGTHSYAYTPSLVSVSGDSVYVTWAMKGGTEAAAALAADLTALDIADGGASTSASKTQYSQIWVNMSTTNYTYSDDALTRLFSSSK
jgi:hypothetical protein